jgi:hypothetical protein
VVERDSATYLVRNCIWTPIDPPDLEVDEQGLTVIVGSIVHEFTDRAEFASFVSHYDDYLDRAHHGSKRARSVR